MMHEETGDWLRRPDAVPCRKWPTQALTDRQINIEEWRIQRRPPFAGSLGAYIRNAIDQSEGEGPQQLFDSIMDRPSSPEQRRVVSQ